MGETAQEVNQANSLFTTEQRRNITISFAEAYLRGSVKVVWATNRSGFGPMDMRTGNPAPRETMAELKSSFDEMLLKACGIGKVKSNTVETAKAVDEVFGAIMLLRSADLLEGEFLGVPDVTSRLSSLEERLSSVEKLLEDLKHIWKVKGP
jgi:hypothetical protein